MFSNNPNVNILTSLIRASKIRHIVVCPGSRNAPIVHNLHALSQQHDISLHSVTDERSATFVALGIASHTHTPTALCVTSGSALLCTLPAVAEAHYRNCPLLVISADRPEEWIDKLDGQTIWQDNALCPYAESFNFADTTEYCSMNEQLMHDAFKLLLQRQRPVHINIQLKEPLFNFTTKELPDVAIHTENSTPSVSTQSLPTKVKETLRNAHAPLLIMGSSDAFCPQYFYEIEKRMACLAEIIANAPHSTLADQMERALLHADTFRFVPDVVVHLGGALIHKRIKQFLRSIPHLKVIRIDANSHDADTFCHLSYSVCMSTEDGLKALAELPFHSDAHARLLESLNQACTPQTSPNSIEETCIAELGQILSSQPDILSALHLGNSMSVRWASRHIMGGLFPVYCNRGTNGIEGSVSAAVGTALSANGNVLLIIGDLSFFYDVNALWNNELGGNLRILLLNNNGGKIFHHLEGLNQSPALSNYIAAHHTATAQGICNSFNCHHKAITETTEINEALNWLLTTDFNRPAVLEILATNDLFSK